MFGVLVYWTDNGDDYKTFKTFDTLAEAQCYGNNLACAGLKAVIYDYDTHDEVFTEFYEI